MVARPSPLPLARVAPFDGGADPKRCARRAGRTLLFAALWLLSLSAVASAAEAGRRDLLWEIVANCLDPGVADYCAKCRWPRVETGCAAQLPCPDSTEVWAESAAFVALRDRKMCGCPKDFVHGLVVPRARVTGVEDPARPVGIWGFAWSQALKRIADQPTAALVVNPAAMRGQDQLHVHILRLRADARLRFSKARTTRVQNLDEVWGAASRIAAAAKLADYGILVASHPQGGFMVLIDSASPEKGYGVERCR